jgi:hypothetical protein
VGLDFIGHRRLVLPCGRRRHFQRLLLLLGSRRIPSGLRAFIGRRLWQHVLPRRYLRVSPLLTSYLVSFPSYSDDVADDCPSWSDYSCAAIPVRRRWFEENKLSPRNEGIASSLTRTRQAIPKGLHRGGHRKYHN